jgi:hypothetical protein
MRLLRLADVPTNERDRVFRYSPGRAVLATCAVIGASGELVALGWHERNALAYYVAAVLLVGLLVLRRFVAARFRPSSWLLRMGDEGVFVQFRSYLNYHFPADDLTVVLIPNGEIRSARRVRERRDIPDRDNPPAQVDRITQVSQDLVELELAVDAAPLALALTEESARRARTGATYRHYPVRMDSPTTLQLEWNVTPRAEGLLDALRQYTSIAAPVDASQHYAHLGGLSREEQERRLLRLAEAGQTIAAIRIARTWYSYDLAQAPAFIDGLRGGKASGAGP